MTQTADQVVATLAGRFAATLDKILPPGKLALVDFPDHSNVGDSAIWLGEMAYLRRAGRMPDYVSALGDHDDDAMAKRIGDGTILIHGGGNFGTLWPKHEAFRLQMLRRHPNCAIVQMPQSIHYDTPERADEMAAAIATHGRFTLLVRDAKSLAFARERFDCAVDLCPDAALMLGRQQRAAPASSPVFALLRTDHERAAGTDAVPPAGVLADDWLAEDPRARNRVRGWLKLRRLLMRDPQAQRLMLQRVLAEWRVKRGLAMLSQGDVVVTDRLHAHILSLLLDIPHVLLDNSYGKVAGFADQWTAQYAGLSRAATRDAAFQAALAAIKERKSDVDP
ncbi:polysaccharide pyruvyl transferase family protein [Sphingomonas sp. SUN019]|uniref:polysaccharide pyruvyl transferase family protein n=1 Tax=Sphingomonas sp. SUN019 TaxID=2937788 RepID=UPI002164985F|nr:polysaccharide pyruvyl transferase family protein [Sphingomonas sp. SUN019]UVO49038.1 polysaccharide pyruvyl transferase family protein [Sphingomonas sp. SUN019]